MSDPVPHIVAPILAPDGFVYADGVKVARWIAERQTLEFVDRNRQRCQERGRHTVEVRVVDVAKLAGQPRRAANPLTLRG